MSLKHFCTIQYVVRNHKIAVPAWKETYPNRDHTFSCNSSVNRKLAECAKQIHIIFSHVDLTISPILFWGFFVVETNESVWL